MAASHRFRYVTFILALITPVILYRFATANQNALQSTATGTIRIMGAVEKPAEWTPEQIKTEFSADMKPIPYTLKGVKGEAQCVPLMTIIKTAKIKLNPTQKNHELAFAIVVKGRDGYSACFSYGELMPEIGKRAVWLALARDGKSLPPAAAPAELLSPDDERPSRWVHAVSSITVIDGML